MASWAFKGQSFDLVADGPIFDEWFAGKTQRTIDEVLFGGGPLRRYVDIGGVAIQPFSGVAQWKGSGASAARTVLRGYRGSVGTLSDDDGRSCQALLADTVDIRVKSPSSGYVRLAVTFEYVGT